MLDDARPVVVYKLDTLTIRLNSSVVMRLPTLAWAEPPLWIPYTVLVSLRIGPPDWPRVVSMMWVISIGVIPVMMLRSFHRVASGLPG